MMNGLFSALSGLRAASTRQNIVAGNVSNVNTNSYKRLRAEQTDLSGGGAEISATSQNFRVGSFVPTDNAMDLSVNGRGFFQVQTSEGTKYTRSGVFKKDGEGSLNEV